MSTFSCFPVTPLSRQANVNKRCQVSSNGPCGTIRTIPGGVTFSGGRPQRCEFSGETALTFSQCEQACLSWNTSPPSGYAILPCAGFETTAIDQETAQGQCNLIRTERDPNAGTDLQCPGSEYGSFAVAAGVPFDYPMLTPNDFCFFDANSQHNPDMPQFTCHAMFDVTLVSECPEETTEFPFGFPNCPSQT